MNIPHPCQTSTYEHRTSIPIQSFSCMITLSHLNTLLQILYQGTELSLFLLITWWRPPWVFLTALSMDWVSLLEYQMVRVKTWVIVESVKVCVCACAAPGGRREREREMRDFMVWNANIGWYSAFEVLFGNSSCPNCKRSLSLKISWQHGLKVFQS